MSKSYDVRVRRGAQLLDEYAYLGDWRQTLAQSDQPLDLASASDCVLGQLFGSFETGVQELGILLGDAQEYGFDLLYAYSDRYDGRYDRRYDALTRAWKRYLGQLDEDVHVWRYVDGV